MDSTGYVTRRKVRNSKVMFNQQKQHCCVHCAYINSRLYIGWLKDLEFSRPALLKMSQVKSAANKWNDSLQIKK